MKPRPKAPALTPEMIGRTVAAVDRTFDLASALLVELPGLLDALNAVADQAKGSPGPGLRSPVKAPFNGPSKPPQTTLRRRYESGARIERDPELRAFILPLILDRTFEQVTAQIAENFPPERHVSRSSLHRWWHLHGKHANSSTGKS